MYVVTLHHWQCHCHSPEVSSVCLWMIKKKQKFPQSTARVSSDSYYQWIWFISLFIYESFTHNKFAKLEKKRSEKSTKTPITSAPMYFLKYIEYTQYNWENQQHKSAHLKSRSKKTVYISAFLSNELIDESFPQ